jgi:hypothetical protein
MAATKNEFNGHAAMGTENINLTAPISDFCLYSCGFLDAEA